MARVIGAVMLFALVGVVGCEQDTADPIPGKVTSDDVREDVGRAIETGTKFSRQTKEEFQKDLDTRLQGLDTKITQLREKGSELKDDAKVEWDKKMADLELKREAARAKLAELGQSSAEAWKDVQKGAKSAWDELDKAFKEASQEF